MAVTSAALVASLCSYGSNASATNVPDPNAGTTAVVGGNANTPVIECAWALNDVNHNWGDLMNYGQDDDPAATPGTPCVADGAVASQPNPTLAPMIHVLPNADDSPTLAWVELWGAVSSSNTANTIVYWDVYHPTPPGLFKVQVDGARYADSSTPDKCQDGVTGPMFSAAQATGQLASGAVTNIVNECKFQQKSLWFGAFGISKHQPYGLYTIVMHAAVAGGSDVTLTYHIFVKDFIQLEKDFATVNFGNVGPNSHSFQPTQGDFVWDGLNNAANQATTVRNTGNAGMGLGVQFASMCLTTAASCTDDKRIDHFDAKFGKSLAGLQTLGATDLATALTSNLASTAKPALLGPEYDFDADLQRTLCPNDPGKIEFSVWTENIQAGTYDSPQGIHLVARRNAICPTDNGLPYNAGPTPTSNTHH